MPPSDFEQNYPHVCLHESFKNNLAKIRRLDGIDVGRMFASHLKELSEDLKPCTSLEELKEFIDNHELKPTIVFPSPYVETGNTNSNNLFYQYKLIQGEADRYYGAMGLFFPVLFVGEHTENLKHICKGWETKTISFNIVEVYFATYY